MLRLSSQGFLNAEGILSKGVCDKQEHTETQVWYTMPETRSLQSLTVGPLRNSRYSFGGDHLDLLTDKKRETKET